MLALASRARKVFTVECVLVHAALYKIVAQQGLTIRPMNAPRTQDGAAEVGFYHYLEQAMYVYEGLSMREQEITILHELIHAIAGHKERQPQDMEDQVEALARRAHTRLHHSELTSAWLADQVRERLATR